MFGNIVWLDVRSEIFDVLTREDVQQSAIWAIPFIEQDVAGGKL